MKKYAFINTNGEVQYTASPAVDTLYSSGELYDNLLCIEVPLDIDDKELILTRYYKNNDWNNRVPKPFHYYIWDNNSEMWIDPRTPATEWPIVRDKRNQLLQASDWTQLPDVPLATKEAWAAYRQALRDVTDQPDPFNIVWPTPPN